MTILCYALHCRSSADGEPSSVVCGFQYVGSTSKLSRLMINKHKAFYLRFMLGTSISQLDFFRHFSEEGDHEFLEEIRVKRLYGKDRICEVLAAEARNFHAPNSQC